MQDPESLHRTDASGRGLPAPVGDPPESVPVAANVLLVRSSRGREWPASVERRHDVELDRELPALGIG
jgi:hypothetical protein